MYLISCWINTRLALSAKINCLQNVFNLVSLVTTSLREKCPNTDFFLVCIFLHSNWIRRFTLFTSKSLYSVRIQENTDQNKLRLWTLFTQCFQYFSNSCNYYQDVSKQKAIQVKKTLEKNFSESHFALKNCASYSLSLSS